MANRLLNKVELRNAVIFCGVACIWLLIDIFSKSIFANESPDSVIAGPFIGLIQINLVHNTGAAWGVFNESTFMLGVISIALCLCITIYVLFFSQTLSLASVIGLALVAGGGLGNAIDRFCLGYVIDFIEPVFIDFPVFNIADIGVTCGLIVFIVGLLFDRKAQ